MLSAVVECDPRGARRGPVLALRRGQSSAVQDWLAEEVPVALAFNGISQAVMMATPADLEDFALGFGITEGLLANPGELHDLDIVEHSDGIELQLTVSAACEWRLKQRRRTLAGRTGCGLCGTDSLSSVRQPLPVVRPAAARLTVIGAALRAMQQQQPLRLMTGSTHAAALCRLTDGGIELLREDVGRHNALDKLIGAMKGRGRNPTAHFIAISSRASFEMVQKTILAGVPVLAAASAPTAMAADLAAASGLLLLGFVRDDEMVAYNFLDRLQHDVQHNK